MSKSPEKLLDYTINMRKRGDDYRAILAYLNRHCDNPEIWDKVLEGLDKLEDEGHIQSQPTTKLPKIYEAVLGYVLIALVGILIATLWEQGWVATLPFKLVAAGFLAHSGQFNS